MAHSDEGLDEYLRPKCQKPDRTGPPFHNYSFYCNYTIAKMALMNTRSSVAARPCRMAMRPAVRPVKAQALFNFGGSGTKTAESTSEFYNFQIKVRWRFRGHQRSSWPLDPFVARVPSGASSVALSVL